MSGKLNFAEIGNAANPMVQGEQQTVGETVATTVVTTNAPAGGGEIMDKVVRDFTTKYQSSTELQKILFSASNDLEVVGSLGYGATGGLIETSPGTPELDAQGNKVYTISSSGKKVPKMIGRKVDQTSEIVGYKIKNNSDKPIPYTKEIYTDVNGTPVGQIQQAELQPGEVVELPTKYVALLVCRPEYSSMVANGRFNRKGKVTQATLTFENMVEGLHFTPNNKSGISVHSEDFKTNISVQTGLSEKGGKLFAVAPEYYELFAYLNNKPDVPVKQAGAKRTVALNIAANADLIMQLAQNQQLK